MTREEIVEFIEDKTDADVSIFENYNYRSAFIGLSSDDRAIYDYDKMIEYLQVEEGMTEEEAAEEISYNAMRALPYLGENPPIIMYPI